MDVLPHQVIRTASPGIEDKVLTTGRLKSVFDQKEILVL